MENRPEIDTSKLGNSTPGDVPGASKSLAVALAILVVVTILGLVLVRYLFYTTVGTGGR